MTLCLIAGCGSGCLHHPLEQPPRKPAAIAETFRQQFAAAQRGSFKATSAALGTNSSALRAASRWYAQYELTLTNTHDAAARPVEFDYYVPRRRPIKGRVKTHDLEANRKIPAILILPIMGGTQYQLESYFARALTKSGFATVILHRPDIKKEVRKLEDIDDLLRRSVRDAQILLDWLEVQPDVDAERLGLFGVSLGAIRGTMVLALDQRVRAAVLGLDGGDLPYILAHTREKGLVRERNKVLAENHWSVDELEQRLRQLITCEPLTVAPAVDPSRVLMVIAAFDHVIPPRTAWELRRKLGNPAAIQIFSGHYSAIVYAPYLRWKTGRFFEKQLSLQREISP